MRLLTFAAMAGNGMTVGMGGGRDLSGHLHPSSLLVLLSQSWMPMPLCRGSPATPHQGLGMTMK